jgi:hypothetical protein
MTADEQYVRSKWEPTAKVPCSEYASIVLDDPYWLRLHSEEAPAWKGAAEFTREREEQIRQVEEEVRLLNLIWPTYYPSDSETMKRILEREQATLAELKKGWRA